ncbi:MAG TPA: nitroreductase family protein [Candidatus Hydrogenedentes bacterium]|nr:nitroreductase family protein [Candidatus Hydrogenedentota bacterium]HQH54463.1 nitroreductase family protein [Candidatus Hydrogenedentota bacterium]HQM51372.1 nitroreductase family protein [Candidatus Hydrogenedentota bacterium]
MAKIEVDARLCKQCGACILTCPENILVEGEHAPRTVHAELCTSCGHCAAICGQGAIHHESFPEGAIIPVKTDLLPSGDQVLEMLRARRSLRVFTDAEVEQPVVERIIEAAQLAPTAHNLQNVEYIVVRKKDELKAISDMAVRFFEKMSKQLRNPLVRGIVRLTSGHEAKSLLDFVPEMEVMVEGHKKGEDFILRGAQCLIVAHVERNIHLPEANAMLALHNASLLAQAMGLGSFLVGYLVGACGRDRSIPDFLGVPKTHRVHGALALGYPKQMFSRWPKRKPPEVTWR